MNEKNGDYRGSSGRQLSKLLEQFELPMAILDRGGRIVYVNAAFCRMAKLEASNLVGQQSSWQVAVDGPASAILTALAPPPNALEGRVTVRQLTVPVVFGASESGQLFLPLCNRNEIAELTLVLFGDFDQIQKSLPVSGRNHFRQTTPDRVLVQIRSRWKTLDGLLAMVGSSPAMELAIWRSQLAISNPANLLIDGPPGVGKLEVAQGIFLGRLKAASIHSALGQFFPLDCRVLDADWIDSMLDIFSGRLQPDVPRLAQQLMLIGVDQLSADGLTRILRWMDQFSDQCWISASSALTADQMISRDANWSRLIHRLAAIEIHLPALTDRREDIPILALQSLSEECKRADRAQLSLSMEASERLVTYSWPGNVRQLRDALKYAVKQTVLATSILAEHLPVAVRTYPGVVEAEQITAVKPIDLDAVLLDVERILLSRAIKSSPRNRAKAARMLGISRSRLLRRIEQLGLDGIQAISPSSDESE